MGKADGKEPEACLKNHSESLLQTESSPEEEYRKLSGHIELKNVTFGYSRLAQPLIRDFNLVASGQQSRFCWTFRSGKSTLSKLISGLHAHGAAKSFLMKIRDRPECVYRFPGCGRSGHYPV